MSLTEHKGQDLKPICTDCAAFQGGGVWTGFSYIETTRWCSRPEGRDLTGGLISLSNMRYGKDAPCGAEGKLFEPKTTPSPESARPVIPTLSPPARLWWQRIFG